MAGARGGALTTGADPLVRRPLRRDMAEAAQPDIARYATFNDFFTRALKPGARPLAEADWLCPVDGAISQFGAIDGDRIFQAKGHDYTATALVGGDAALARQFHGGHFATLYLSPRDYHRIHMPCAGRLLRMIHVPGALFSVNPTTARGVPGLFARNERVVCVFDGRRTAPSCWCWWAPPSSAAWPPPGTAWSTRRGRARCASGATTDRDLRLARGAEMGRFLLGSTVVLLFPPGPLRFNPPGRPVAPSAWARRWPASVTQAARGGWARCCCGWCRRCGRPTT
jgi:phosphatidylserine decarboxylase